MIASLVNQHSRPPPTQEAVDSYNSSQRRVDALSVVHRNHYAELEVHPGIGVRSLISELSVSLRGSMPEDAPNVAIHVQSDHLFVSQDVAVPVAFLITELVELATLINPRSEEHTSELQSLMRIWYAVFCLKSKNNVPDTTL